MRNVKSIDELVEEYVARAESDGGSVIMSSYDDLVVEALDAIDWVDYTYRPGRDDEMSGKNRLRKHKWKHGKPGEVTDFVLTIAAAFFASLAVSKVLISAAKKIIATFNKDTRHCVTKFGSESNKCIAEAQVKRLSSELALLEGKALKECKNSPDQEWCKTRIAKKIIDIKSIIKKLKRKHGID